MLLAGCASTGPAPARPPAPAAPPIGPAATPAPLGPAAAAACRRLLDRLPATLRAGVTRRPAQPADRFAAWGEPPMTLLCGAEPVDAGLTPIVVDGLPLVAEQLPSRVRWTTTDRVVTVQLSIPLRYADQAELVVPLVPALRALPPR